MRYAQHPLDEEGWTEWIFPTMHGYKLACCDCGLVHDMTFAVKDGRVAFKAARNTRSTAQKRRHLRSAA